jgi:hypothetical protein
MRKPVQLHLVELMETDQSTGVAAVAARLASETGAVGGVAEGKLISRDDLIAMQGGHRNLGCGSQPQVIVGAAKTVISEFGQLT